jgi:outer membrane receptor for ferrienterochelin and colicins
LKKLFIFAFSFVNVNLYSQRFQVLNARTQQPIENVQAVLFQKGTANQLLRSNYKGEVIFQQTDIWDSVVFFRLGYKRQVVEKVTNFKIILLTPMQNQIEEVIITGQIIPSQKYQSPFKIRYFTAEEIKNKNSINLADFLQTENNFTVTQDAILGSKVAINGMSGSDLKLMVDGIPVAGRLNGNIDYSQILLSNIERIEIVDGPLSTIYGTNATGGVINLITKTGSKYKSNISGAINAESIGSINSNVYFNNSNQGHQISIGAHRNVFQGWDPRADSLSQAIKPIWRSRVWKPKEQTMFNTSYYAPLSKKVNLHLKLDGFWETLINKIDPNSAFQSVVQDEYYSTSRYNIGGTSNALLTKNIEFQNVANFNYFGRITDFYSQNLREGTRILLKQNSEEIYNVFGRSQIKQEFKNENYKLLYGADYNMDIGNSDKLDTNQSSVYDLSFFTMANIKLNSWQIQPGMRYSFNNRATMPVSMTFNIRKDISTHFSSRLSFSRGYRIPEIKELYFRFVDINHNIQGNPNLGVELNDNFQFGIDIKPPKSTDSIRKKLISYSSSFTTSYFHKQNAIDIISIDPLKNEFKYMNVGDYYGLVFNADNRVKYKEYLFSFGISVNGFSKRFDNLSQQIDQFLFNWTSNANLTYHFKKYDVKLSSINKFNSTNEFVIYNILKNRAETTTIPAFMYSDINLSKSIFKDKINLTVGVKNIFDIQNLQVTGFSGSVHSRSNEVNNLWGRTIFTTISFNFEVLK